MNKNETELSHNRKEKIQMTGGYTEFNPTKQRAANWKHLYRSRHHF